jgi:hypothetical protein
MADATRLIPAKLAETWEYEMLHALTDMQNQTINVVVRVENAAGEEVKTLAFETLKADWATVASNVFQPGARKWLMQYAKAKGIAEFTDITVAT